MKYFLALFIYIKEIHYADGMQKSGKHKKARKNEKHN